MALVLGVFLLFSIFAGYTNLFDFMIPNNYNDNTLYSIILTPITFIVLEVCRETLMKYEHYYTAWFNWLIFPILIIFYFGFLAGYMWLFKIWTPNFFIYSIILANITFGILFAMHKKWLDSTHSYSCGPGEYGAGPWC
ncbi:MAG: hypothetical protein FWF51_09105 [Chitinivibrionia bacterium]|nr:hypothetical protein [Chitinivibrionia bacterium]